MSDCQLYLITPPQIDDLQVFAGALEDALAAGPAAVQLRLKGPADPETGLAQSAPDDVVLAAGARLIPLIQAAGAAAIVNDRPDLALALNADGVHVGQSDASVAAARAALGPSRTVGATCHNSRDLAMTAAEAGADYVAFGAFFDTSTKQASTRADPEILSWWSQIFLPSCVAIGGITAHNCAPLVRAGADFLAVSAAVWNHPEGAGAGAQAMQAAIRTALAAANEEAAS